MTKGKHAANVNAALRSDLAAAIDRADRAERITAELRHQLAASQQRIEDLSAEFHPELREAIAREQHRENELRRLAADSERADKVYADILEGPLHELIKAAPMGTSFITAEFMVLMKRWYGAEFLDWCNAASLEADGTPLPNWSSRDDRRETMSRSEDDLYRSFQRGIDEGRGAPKLYASAGANMGLAAVQRARSLRLAGEAKALREAAS